MTLIAALASTRFALVAGDSRFMKVRFQGRQIVQTVGRDDLGKVHPCRGGWFALGGALIFTDALVERLTTCNATVAAFTAAIVETVAAPMAELKRRLPDAAQCAHVLAASVLLVHRTGFGFACQRWEVRLSGEVQHSNGGNALNVQNVGGLDNGTLQRLLDEPRWNDLFYCGREEAIDLLTDLFRRVRGILGPDGSVGGRLEFGVLPQTDNVGTPLRAADLNLVETAA